MIDSSLSLDPLVVELGKRTVIAGKLTVNPFVSLIHFDLLTFCEMQPVLALLIDFLCVIFLSGLEQALVGVCEG